MVAVLITTGKNPSESSRAIARALHLAIPHSMLEFRGSRTLDALIAKARKRHFSRVCSIYSKQGKPHSLSFLSIRDDGGWERLKPVFIMEKAQLPPIAAKIPQSCSLKITGANAKAARHLFSPSNDEYCEQTSRIVAGRGTLALYVGKRKILSLGVKYGR